MPGPNELSRFFFFIFSLFSSLLDFSILSSLLAVGTVVIDSICRPPSSDYAVVVDR